MDELLCRVVSLVGHHNNGNGAKTTKDVQTYEDKSKQKAEGAIIICMIAVSYTIGVICICWHYNCGVS